MSEERLQRIEEQLAVLTSEVARKSDLEALASDVARKSDLAALASDMARKSDLAALASDMARKSDLAALAPDMARKSDLEALRNQMLVLHEDTIERIAALAPDFTPIRREFREATAQLREDIERRLEPLEAAFRSRRRR